MIEYRSPSRAGVVSRAALRFAPRLRGPVDQRAPGLGRQRQAGRIRQADHHRHRGHHRHGGQHGFRCAHRQRAAVALPEKPADAVALTPAKSKIEWTGSKVSGKHEGSFQQFDGWISLPDDKPENAKIAVAIDMTSVKSDDDKLTGHLKSGDFFEVEKFPKASFVSTEIKPGGDKGATHTITGNLNLRGVEKSVTFPATVKVTADKVTAKSEFSINRKDWGIVYAGKADDLIRDGVVIKLDLSADRPKK